MTDHSKQQRRRDLTCISLVVLAWAGLAAVDIGVHRPAYFVDYKTNANPDARHYILLGHNLWLHGAYSRVENPPYSPDMLRTPVYPVVAGGLDYIFGVWSVYVLQTACRMATAWALYLMALPIFGRRIVLMASILFACDATLMVLDFETMAESLFTFLATSSVLLWLRNLFTSLGEHRPIPQAIIVGVLLGLAIQTRPTALYLPIVLAGLEACLAVYKRDLRLIVRTTAMLCAVGVVVGPWIVRNAVVFDIPRLTHADTINLVYCAGAGAYSIEHGIPRDVAQKRIQREFGIESMVKTNNAWRSQLELKQIDAEQRIAFRKILRRYPLALAKASTLGIAKSLVSHNVDGYSAITGRTWHPPGLDNALSMQWGELLASLNRNSLITILLFCWQVAFACSTLILGVWGSIVGLRHKQWRVPVLCLLVITAYYGATIAVVGLDAHARHRSMLAPFVCVLAALAISDCYRRLKRDDV